MTVSTISPELLIFLQPNLIGWYTIISWKHVLIVYKFYHCVKTSRLWSQWRFKTSLTLYLSNIFCTTGLLATKLGVLIHNQTKYIYKTLTYSITRHTTWGGGGGGFCHTRQQTLFMQNNILVQSHKYTQQLLYQY